MSLTHVRVATRRPYEVRIGPGALRELEAAVCDAVLCDRTVEGLHAARLGTCSARPRLALEPGEAAKSLATLEHVLDFMVAAGLDRTSTLVGFGGGVVGDLAGLAAGLFMRGIACVQCPTTLLAQVDASVGGKTAVNLRAGKNLAGLVHQPALVLADTELLATLPDEELRSGLGEVVKSALIGDARLLERLEQVAAELRARDADVLREVVERCVRVKAEVVARDEVEARERRSLNLGHTFGHALEHAAGFGRIPHGVAVGVGLVLALLASRQVGLLRDPDLPERTVRLLEALGLPASVAGLRSRYGVPLRAPEVLAGMRHDKKGRASRPAFVLVRAAEDLLIDQELDERALAALCA